jgi:hypothetical protein
MSYDLSWKHHLTNFAVRFTKGFRISSLEHNRGRVDGKAHWADGSTASQHVSLGILCVGPFWMDTVWESRDLIAMHIFICERWRLALSLLLASKSTTLHDPFFRRFRFLEPFKAELPCSPKNSGSVFLVW